MGREGTARDAARSDQVTGRGLDSKHAICGFIPLENAVGRARWRASTALGARYGLRPGVIGRRTRGWRVVVGALRGREKSREESESAESTGNVETTVRE